MPTKPVYYSDFYDANGKRHRRRHPSRREALAATRAGKAEAARAHAARLTKIAQRSAPEAGAR